MNDHLEEAVNALNQATESSRYPDVQQARSQQAIAHALIDIAETLRHILERLRFMEHRA